MSQSGLADSLREPDWDRWYVEHLKIMVSVPGIESAQRFRTSGRGHPPSLAIYTVASAAVFDDPYYLSVRGMGEWAPLIDRRYYRRNLFDGARRAPEVGAGRVLLVADRQAIAPDPVAHLAWTWLECVGIDRSTPYRALAVADANEALALGSADDVAVYAPASERYVKP